MTAHSFLGGFVFHSFLAKSSDFLASQLDACKQMSYNTLIALSRLYAGYNKGERYRSSYLALSKQTRKLPKKVKVSY